MQANELTNLVRAIGQAAAAQLMRLGFSPMDLIAFANERGYSLNQQEPIVPAPAMGSYSIAA